MPIIIMNEGKKITKNYNPRRPTRQVIDKDVDDYDDF